MCICIHIYICMYVYIYTYICTYIYTYTDAILVYLYMCIDKLLRNRTSPLVLVSWSFSPPRPQPGACPQIAPLCRCCGCCCGLRRCRATPGRCAVHLIFLLISMLVSSITLAYSAGELSSYSRNACAASLAGSICGVVPFEPTFA